MCVLEWFNVQLKTLACEDLSSLPLVGVDLDTKPRYCRKLSKEPACDCNPKALLGSFAH